jgi:hypothetical protein
LAALVGAYCWIEQRIFEVTGAWATGPGPVDGDGAELRVWAAATSRRHGAVAGLWADRLPVRASVEPAALITAPAGPEGLAEAFDELGAIQELLAGVYVLVATVLPWVGGIYGSHLGVATPVSEASVMEVLVEARREASAEIQGGWTMLRGLLEAGKPSGHIAEVFKRTFSQKGISPAVRPG